MFAFVITFNVILLITIYENNFDSKPIYDVVPKIRSLVNYDNLISRISNKN